MEDKSGGYKETMGRKLSGGRETTELELTRESGNLCNIPWPRHTVREAVIWLDLDVLYYPCPQVRDVTLWSFSPYISTAFIWSLTPNECVDVDDVDDTVNFGNYHHTLHHLIW